MELLNTYKTNLCRNALDHWEPHEGVREVIQNMLDSDGKYYYQFSDDKLVLGNENIKLHPQVLLMGKSDKRNSPETIGKFGTGFLFGISVLLDSNINIEMYNNDVIWKPCFEYCDTYQDDIVVIKEFSNPVPTSNYEVVISNLQEVDINNIVETCLLFQEREILAETKYGNIIANPEDDNGGEIFVKGLFVTQNACLKYSYDFLPEYLPLNQDRNLADTWELQQLTAKMWHTVEDQELLKGAIKSESVDCQLVSTGWNVGYSKPHAAVESLAEEFFEEKGECMITDSYDDYKELKAAGNKVELVSQKALYESILSSNTYNNYVNSVEVVERPPLKDLIEQYLEESFEVMYNARLISTEQQGTDEIRKGNNHLVDLHEQILQRIEEEL